MTEIFGDVVSEDISDHVPVMVLFHDGTQRARCEACGWLWPCRTVSNEPAALTDDDKELIRIVEIGIGFAIWQRLPENADPERRRTGGTVLGWEDDRDVGRTYTVLDFERGRPRFEHLRAIDIDPMSIQLPNAAHIRDRARRLAELYTLRKGITTEFDVDCLRHAFTLARAVL